MKKGFTLIELIMVIIILGILSIIVMPRFVDLQAQAKVSASKGVLGSIRSAISMTYGNNLVHGVTPAVPQNIDPSMFNENKIPVEPLTDSNAVTFVSSSEEISNGAGWAYDAVNGRVWVNNSQYTSY